MTEQELEHKVICIIEKEYKCKFIGKLKVRKHKGIITVAIGLRAMEMPLVLGGTLDDESFLQYIKMWMRKHRLDKTEYFTGYKISPEIDPCFNPRCDCNA